MGRDRRGPVAALEVLAADIDRDRAALDERLSDLRLAMSDEGRTFHPKARGALIAVSIHGAYSAVESALERVADTIDGARPTGPHWHADLLDRMSAPFGDRRGPVLTAESARAMRKIVSFRHFFRHCYAAELDIDLLEVNASLLLRSASAMAQDLEQLVSRVRAMARLAEECE